MNIFDKKNLFNQISDKFVKYVVSPENSFSIDNPDILVLEGNTAYAIFIPTYDEYKNLDHLLRRLYVSQLSYGIFFISILFLDKPELVLERRMPTLKTSFGHISYTQGDVIHYVKGGLRKDLQRWKQIGETRQYNIVDYKTNVEFSRLNLRHPNMLYQKDIRNAYVLANHIPCWKDSSVLCAPRNIKQSQYGILFDKERNSGTFKENFQSLMTYVMMSRFDWDDGGVYYSKNSKNAMNIVKTNWELFDVEKYPTHYNRSLSFIGSVPMSNVPCLNIDDLYTEYIKIKSNIR